MRRFDPTSWPQHRPDLGSTSASKAPTSAQLPFGSNFGPSGGPCGFKMEDIAGPIRNHVFFAVGIMLHLKQCSHMFPMFFLCSAQLGAKLSPKGAKLRHVRTELGFHVHQMATIWNPSGSLWAQLQPYC